MNSFSAIMVCHLVTIMPFELISLFNAQNSAYLFGLISAFTPCTIAIFPIFLYRFGFWGKDKSPASRNYRGLILASVSFIASFAITGIVLQQIIVSEFANVFRIVLGSLLVFAGLLQWWGKLQLQMINKFSHPILVGGSLPWLLSFSPCVLTFTATLLVGSLNTAAAQSASTAFQFTLFAAGMLTPVVILVLVGNTALRLMQRSSRIFGLLEKLTPLVLIITGIYLTSQLVQITTTEVEAAAAILGLFSAAAIWHMIRTARKRGRLHILMIVGSALVLLLAVWLFFTVGDITMPYDIRSVKGRALLYLCLPDSHQTSPAAIPLGALFSSYMIILAAWFNWGQRKLNIRFTLKD